MSKLFIDSNRQVVMKYFIILLILSPVIAFSRAPAVEPTFKVINEEDNSIKKFIYINGKPVEASKIAFTGNFQETKTIKGNTKTPPFNLAPTFLMFFALSIPFFATLFMRDEQTYESDTIDELNSEETAEIVEVNFKNNSNKKDEIKKAS